MSKLMCFTEPYISKLSMYYIAYKEQPKTVTTVCAYSTYRISWWSAAQYFWFGCISTSFKLCPQKKENNCLSGLHETQCLQSSGSSSWLKNAMPLSFIRLQSTATQFAEWCSVTITFDHLLSLYMPAKQFKAILILP